MKTHLEKVYTVLLQFFQGVTRVFSKGHDAIRKLLQSDAT